jgi:glucose dehydrogenase
MKWLTAKRQVKLYYAAAAVVVTCGAAMAASDTEQFQRFQDPNQWGAPAGDLNQNRYSALKEINTSNVKGLQMIWAQSSGTLQRPRRTAAGHRECQRQADDVHRERLAEHHPSARSE